MTARRCLAAAIALACAAALLAFAGLGAAAAHASLAIEHPADGSTSNESTPTFSGSTEDELDPVAVYVYKGTDTEGQPEQTLSTVLPPLGESWSLEDTSALPDGTYTAVAEQSPELGEPTRSAPVTFTIDTQPPRVTLDQPPSPSNDTTPTFEGEAGDSTEVVVHIRRGESLVETASATPTNGHWSLNDEGALQDGTYTAVATEKSSLGNAPGESAPVTFTIDTASPEVTLNQPTSPSSDTTPTFSGFASELTAVHVAIHEGSSVKGPIVASASAEGTGAEWKSGAAAPALHEGTYTAVATQESSLGNPAGQSVPVTFTVITASPHVTLDQPSSPSKDTAPSFTGSASDLTTVTIDIYEGSSASGPVVASAAATGTGGGWASGHASPALASGVHTYTAVATQESSLGNPAGHSAPVTFVVNTTSPTVTLQQPPTPSNDSTPTFNGAASDSTKVLVHIRNGLGVEVATATATPSGGEWSTHSESPLSDGTYTAVATQESSLGNPPGESGPVTFTIDTKPPTVTLNAPQLRSNDRTPSFEGTASETTPVTVKIYEGGKPEGTLVATAGATGTGGAWTSGQASPPLAAGDHTYTAIAVQESSLGNPAGKSAPVTFVVDTTSPTVTLNAVTSPSNNTAPTFSGSASETTAITIRIYEGTSASGKEVATAAATGTGGAWSSGTAKPSLATGVHTYTAVASQESPLGNPPGQSAPVTFIVNTEPPTVTLDQPRTPSNQTTPVFTGTAADTTPVTVHIHEGSSLSGPEVSTATAVGTGGAWASGHATPALAPGVHTYTAVATQESSIGNAAGHSAAVTFVVNTTSPTVTLEQPPTPSNDLTPTFAGAASDSTRVVVHIRNGLGLEVASATATPSGGKWSTHNESSLSDGTYTAVATQESSLGNPQGESAAVTFVIDTKPPTVFLQAPPPASNDANPSFSGTASDTTPVTVYVYEGLKPEGTVKATAIGIPQGSAGEWSTKPVSLASGKHTYTAIAVQESSLHNPSGKSAPVTFVVDTAAPTVTLEEPFASTNDPTPSFSGTATEFKEVTVKIYSGGSPSGHLAATATASGTGGHWMSAPATPPLAEGQYTAIATQKSVAGDEGDSRPFTFVVDLAAPLVTITAPASGSTTGETTVVSGTAGTAERDLPSVAVELFAGNAIAEGAAPMRVETVPTVGGRWSATIARLAPGTYSARARQRDGAGNVGTSATTTFTVPAPPPPASGPPPGPQAAFVWFPAHPRVGEPVTFASTSTDAASPLTSFAWDLQGHGLFGAGGSGASTTFTTPGGHLVQLRVADATGRSSVSSQTVVVASALLPELNPFPIVRIISSDTVSGVKVKLLTVLSPASAIVTVTCHGHGCPVRAQSHIARRHRSRTALVEFRRFERALPAGVTLEITVTARGHTGKYTKFVVRRRRLPLRIDGCVAGMSIKPISCPRP